MQGKLQDSLFVSRHKIISTHWRALGCTCCHLDLREWAHGLFCRSQEGDFHFQIQKKNTEISKTFWCSPTLKAFNVYRKLPPSTDGKLPLDRKSCPDTAAVFLTPCFDRLSCSSQKFDFRLNKHSKCAYFIKRKKSKIALQVLPCFAIALYLIKPVSLKMDTSSTVAFIFIVVFAGFFITDNSQSHKS